MAVSTEVPRPFPVAVDDHSYLVDYASEQFRIQSVPLLRAQGDSSEEPGGASLNPEDLWRRNQETWHLGQGQTFADRPDSQVGRYYQSAGVDVWDKWELKLLKDVDQKKTGSTSGWLVACGGYLYYAENNALYRTSDITAGSPTWTTITGDPAGFTGGFASIAAGGNTLYMACGSDGLYGSAVSGTTASSLVTGTVAGVAIAKERLMCWSGTSLYNVTTLSGSLPSALLTIPFGMNWTDVVGGRSFIYAGATDGATRSVIYKTAVKADGTALDVPSVAGELPAGEVLTSLGAYAGFVLIGTNAGFRVALEGTDGNLTLGPFISTNGTSVKQFIGWGRFVWLAGTEWTIDGTTYQGLGRLDMSTDVGDGQVPVPAYATDLINTGLNSVGATVARFNNLIVFGDTSGEVYAEDVYRSSGVLTTGQFTYGLADAKRSHSISVRHDALPAGSPAGGIRVDQSIDGGAYAQVGATNTTAASKATDVTDTSYTSYERVQVKLTISAPSGLASSPVVKRLTLKAQPIPTLKKIITLPIILRSSVLVGSQRRSMDVDAERNYLEGLRDNGTVVTVQLGDNDYTCVMRDFTFIAEEPQRDGTGPQGVFVAQFRSL